MFELTDPKLVANAFNNYFANVGVHLARLIPDVNKSPLEYLKNPSCKNFYLFPVTPVESGMCNQMVTSEIKEFHARFVQILIISRNFRRGKLLGFGQNAREIIP